MVKNRAPDSSAAGFYFRRALFLARATHVALDGAWVQSWSYQGWLIRALASGHVRKNESLATSGPYAYTRNPLYLGSLLMGVGFAVAARSWWVGIALVVMFLAIYMPVIRDEEDFLQRTFPEFDEYAQRVPRMVPRLTAYADDNNKGQSGFSLGLYLKHREYNALLGAAAMTLALLFKLALLRLPRM